MSPLSHPLLGIGNYIQGSLAGLAEASAGRHELVAFAPTSIRGPKRIRAALEGIDVEIRTWPLPFSHAVRTVWSGLGHPATERLLGPFDALHFSDWMYPPQRAGVRATTIHDLVPLHHPEWTTARTRSMHGRKYRNAAETCDVVFVNSAYTGRDVDADPRRPARAGPRRASGSEGGLPRRRAGDRPRRAVRPHGRDARAAEESAGARRGASAARRRPPARRSSAARAGASNRSSTGRESGGSGSSRTRSSRASTVERRWSRIPRASKVSGFPCSKRWHAASPSSSRLTSRWTKRPATAAVRADPEDPAEFAAAIERARTEREVLVARGLEHVKGFSWRAVGEVFLRGYEEARA